MDNTSSTVGGTDDVFLFNTGYVSCIKVDGQPILPPLMTEKRREEMRQYKEQAIIREKELLERRVNQVFRVAKLGGESLSHKKQSSFAKHLTAKCAANPVDLPDLRGSRSASTSPVLGVPATSTPRIRRTYSIPKIANQVEKPSSGENISPSVCPPGDASGVPEGVLREREIIVPSLDLNKSVSSVPSADGSSALSYDGDEEKDLAATESEDQKSEENFASAASSTGTFVIRRSSENRSSESMTKKGESAEHQNTSSDEDQLDQDNKRSDPPTTVVRKPSVQYKRKRPAKYFDLDDEEIDMSKGSTFSSIPNYVPENHSESQKTSIIADTSGASSRFSPVAITNFSSLAKSLTIEFSKKFCTTSKSSSTTSTGNKSDSVKAKGKGGSYDVRLSKDIPSSAEKLKVTDEDAISNSSDKENIDMNASAKHVRKLSYTLATPSAALLEAVSKSKDKFYVQSLETVPSAPSSVDVQSAYQTPEKTTIKEFERNQGHGKQAHLERFLGEQENLAKTTSTTDESPQSVRAVQEMQQILKKVQEEHEIQLRRLAEQHRLQELRIKQDFEKEMEKLKEKFSSAFNSAESSKASPNSFTDSVSVNNSGRSRTRTNTAGSEVKSISGAVTGNTNNSEQELSAAIELQTKTKNSSVYQFTGCSSTIGETSSNSTCTNNGAGPVELSGVGLSKLQSRMQLMSPRIFRTPADARSPLLKGIVFLDPLNKPNAPLRIPQKALEPEMKSKFDRISAAVKGFLTRRLLNTEKVQIIVQTIRDTVDLLLKIYEEVPPASGDGVFVKPQDNELHQRLIQQLTGACRSFHDVFFKLSIKERMAIIATDREKLKAKALRNAASPTKPNISNATLKSLGRRMSHGLSPKRDNRKSRTSKVYDPFYGSQSVKPKSIKTFNISPKRRRISYWDDKNAMTRSTPSLVGKHDQNGNNYKVNSSKPQASSRIIHGPARTQQIGAGGFLGETFIVPSVGQSSRNLSNNMVKSCMGSLSVRRDSTSVGNAKSVSARSTQSSISVASSSSGTNKSRASLSRQPWK